MELSGVSGKRTREGRANSQPAVCPVGNCRTIVAHTHLLRHMISDHLDPRARALPFQLRLREVAIGQKTMLMLAYRQLVLDRDYCLAVLNWRQPDIKLGPGELAPEQLDLPPCHQTLAGHLPVLVMVCRTTWKALLTHEDRAIRSEQYAIGARHPDPSREWGTVYLFWLLCPVTRRPVTATLTVLNSELECIERRNRRRIRNFACRMPIQQFINGLDPTFVTINEEKMDRCCRGTGRGDKASAIVEVIIEGEATP
ncbi:hypothetical protein KR067_002211 [Drosophila pandora]|nr:hypothetical protein KR067_002211 [Drosophila pandora]